MSPPLFGARLNGANLTGADLLSANLTRASLTLADVDPNLLTWLPRDADRTRTSVLLDHANLDGTILHEANLTSAYVRFANITHADPARANLSQVHLNGTLIQSSRLWETNLDLAVFGETILANVDLSEAVGLDTVLHLGPSTLGVDTLYRSQGKIPDVFLRRVGLPDPFIDYARSLVGSPIQFYSCFISYSTKDQEFAERLHADLQSRGVRCWFAPEDMKIGDKTLDSIDQSIRLHDKLLLVLSQHSVASGWVEDEVTKAFAEERRRKQTVLFPIRIDDAVMGTEEAWAVKIRDNRHIGDFREWKNHDGYQRGLKRLLRDLKAGS